MDFLRSKFSLPGKEAEEKEEIYDENEYSNEEENQLNMISAFQDLKTSINDITNYLDAKNPDGLKDRMKILQTIVDTNKQSIINSNEQSVIRDNQISLEKPNLNYKDDLVYQILDKIGLHIGQPATYNSVGGKKSRIRYKLTKPRRNKTKKRVKFYLKKGKK